MLGAKKEKVPFGQRKSNGSFGKKPAAKPLGSKKSVPKNRVLEKNLPEQKERLRAAKPVKSMFEKPQKQMAKKSKNKLATAEEKEFMKWLHSEAVYFDYPCFVCGKINPNDGIEWHHVKEGSGDEKNHKRQIPLCGNEHHRTGAEISPHGTPKKWRETYSVEVQNKFAGNVWNDFKRYKRNMGA